MNHTRVGYLYAFAAYFLWGLFPLYWKLLEPASPLEVLAHRVLWSAVLVMLILVTLRRVGTLRDILATPRKLAGIALAGLLISGNWGVYIYAVHTDHVLESALGYYINPLMFVIAGLLVFGERLRPLQWTAVAFGAASVATLTVDYGRLPWIALVLAACFALYGVVKKRLGLPAVQGMFWETAAVVVPAMAFLAWLNSTGEDTFARLGWGHALIMASAGVATAVPLLFFAGAANRIPMVAIGIMQYIAPSMHMVIGVAILGEPMTPVSWAGFALIWTALAVFTVDAVRASRAVRESTVKIPAAVE
ncbi:EamA family transporter RarD [Salininema proteolyticum]|uniref:EamA family transporter RarD n=1 Tax=Salininema proteolyticum TaxID=1607685 RepID=A0ABV8TV07_9ACTN